MRKEKPRRAEDQAFVEKLYRKHQPWMLRLAMQYTPELMDAEDILSQVCVQMFGKVDLLRSLSEKQEYAYLSRAVRNAAISHLRRQTSLQKYLADAQARSDPQDATEENLLLSELWETILRETASYPETERNVIWLKYKLGMTTEEIAEHLGMTQSSVRSALSRALAKLRSALTEGRGQ